MSRYSQSLLLATAGVFLSLAAPAISAPKEAAALKLDSDAINNDYLATNFNDAEKKLKQAIALCGAKNCSGKVRGQIHRDLAVIYIAGLKKVDEGKAQLSEALKADPAVALDRDLTTPELQAAFAAVKGATPAAVPPAGAAEAPAATASAAVAAAATGDITHTPPAGQTVLTPVPIYVELASSLSASKVQLRYKPFGASDWKTLELRRVDGGYGGEISCLEVGSATGDLNYFVQAVDANGDVIAISGSKTAPHHVTIQAKLTGEAPHLPGKPPPRPVRRSKLLPPRTSGLSHEGDAQIWR